jgi:hypothetical protein
MKLLIITNNVTDLDTLHKGIDLAVTDTATIGLTLEIGYYDLVKQLTSIPFDNLTTISDTKNGYVADPTSYTGVWDIGYDAVCCIFDPTKITPSPTNPFDNGQTMSIPITWYTTFPEVLREYLLHELSHLYFAKTGQKDITHYYDPAFAQKQRYEWYLYLLKGLINPSQTTKPDVVITRQPSDSKQTLGVLRTSDGLFGCNTLELAWNENQPNISCIPTGMYQVKKIFSLKFGFVYEIQNVLNRFSIYFHEGNFFYDTHGCVLLGSLPQDINSDGEKDLLNTRSIRKAFQNYMNWKPFTLLIQ